MVNDTIVNARNFSDRLCNEVILWSNDFARDLGASYGELWAGIYENIKIFRNGSYSRFSECQFLCLRR